MLTEQIAVTTTGDAGEATGTTTSARYYEGYLYAIDIDYHGSAPDTTVVEIVHAASGDVLFTAPADNVDAKYYPEVAKHTLAGAANGAYGLALLELSQITVNVTLSDALTGAVTVSLQYLERLRNF